MSTIGRVLHACCPTRVFAVFFVVAISSMAAVLSEGPNSDTTTSADTAAKPDSAKPAAAPKGICLNCGPGDNPPTVPIAPVAGTFGSGTQTVTVDWCDDNGPAAAPRADHAHGVDITTEFTYVTVTPSSCGDEEKSVGTITLHAGANSIRSPNKGWRRPIRQCVGNLYVYAVSHRDARFGRPDGLCQGCGHRGVHSQEPDGWFEDVYALPTCPTGWTCMGAPGSVTLNAGVSTDVTCLIYSGQ